MADNNVEIGLWRKAGQPCLMAAVRAANGYSIEGHFMPGTVGCGSPTGTLHVVPFEEFPAWREDKAAQRALAEQLGFTIDE